MNECLDKSPNSVRFHREDERDVVVASLLSNPYRQTRTIFLQVVPEVDGLKDSNEDKKRRLEKVIFDQYQHLKPRVQGSFGAFRPKMEGLSLQDALKLFNTTYLTDKKGWDEGFRLILKSEVGQEYIQLRLSEWVER